MGDRCSRLCQHEVARNQGLTEGEGKGFRWNERRMKDREPAKGQTDFHLWNPAGIKGGRDGKRLPPLPQLQDRWKKYGDRAFQWKTLVSTLFPPPALA